MIHLINRMRTCRKQISAKLRNADIFAISEDPYDELERTPNHFVHVADVRFNDVMDVQDDI